MPVAQGRAWASPTEKRKALGVEEYFTVEPPDEFVEPRLRGWRREGGVLVPIEAERTADGRLRLASEKLGVYLEDEVKRPRLRDRETGEPLLFADEEDHFKGGG